MQTYFSFYQVVFSRVSTEPHGAVELPFVLRSYFREGKINIAHFGGLSFYRRERGSLIMEQYSRDVLESAIPNADRIEELINPRDNVILLDDNVMTGRTIELAMDRLIAYGVEVPLVICVRFPMSSRTSHMSIPRHGGVDPHALNNVIKGLVAPSPYSRLLSSEAGYEDSLGIFDRSRDRIVQYLKKNGIFSMEDKEWEKYQ